MVQVLQEEEYPSDIKKIDFLSIKAVLEAKNIRFFHLMRQPHIPLQVTPSLVLEGDNNFWGAVNSTCSMGAFSYTSSNFSFGVSIGRYCSIAHNVTILGAAHFPEWVSTHPIFYNSGHHTLDPREITHNKRQGRILTIGHDVWIGANVVLKPHLTIGNGAIIAANSVVTKDVPPFAIVAGVPAKIIRYRFSEQLMQLMDKLQWWQYHHSDLKGLYANEPEKFMEMLQIRIQSAEIQSYQPQKLTFSDLSIR